MKNKKINESITSSAVSPFSYIILIDAARSIGKVKSYIRMIFPKENPDVVKSWFKKITISDFYSENKDKLESLSSRFFGNAQLNSLFSALQKIKDMPYTSDEKELHEKDIQKLIEKISIYIKRRLTDVDFELLDKISSEINHVSEKISEKIDSDVEFLSTAEEPVSSPDEEPKEKKVSERLKNKLRKKIKEIVRTHMISGRYK